MRVGQDILRVTMLGALALGLSGCMSDMPDLKMPDFDLPDLPSFGLGGDDDVTRATPASAFVQAQDERGEDHRSTTIDALISRPSVLPDRSPYAKVADAVLSASSRSAEADLMRARMRAKAADKNWLPRLGPNVSLTSLSSLVASLVIDQVLLDNGRRAAERDFARADVEAAAVGLSIDQNDRVHDALGLYLAAEEARAKAAASGLALTDMRELDRIMAARVAGGVSDRSEHNVIRAKLNELAAGHDNERNIAETAIAELQAMAAGPIGDIRGISALDLPGGVQPLSLLLAGAERDRDVAASKIERAGLLPGVAAAATVAGDGGLSSGVRLTSEQGIGFGMFDNMAASDASADAADRRVAQADEDARRRIASLTRKREALVRKAGQSATLSRQGRANADLFQRQYKAGTRSVLEVAGVIETMARLEQDVVAAKFEIARVEIQIARELGLLASGDRL